MSVVNDVQTRVAAITELLAAVSPPPAVSGEFSSVLAAVAAPSAGDTSTQPSPSSVTGADIVADAFRYLGVPYRYGGTDPRTGLDCSALVQRVYQDLGIALPRTSQQQATVGVAIPSLAQAQPGDLVCFGDPATHIGIYVGNGKMIVAPHTGTVVQVQDITVPPTTIRRVVAGVSLFSGVPVDRPVALSATGAGSSSSDTSGGAYAALFDAAERRYGLPTGLLAAVAKVESDFQPDAVSPAGAVGLMQLMPGTAAALGVDPRDPAQAIDGAARLLAGELAKYGSLPLALAAYNAGGPAVDRYNGIPPYPETQQYVQKVLATMSEGL